MFYFKLKFINNLNLHVTILVSSRITYINCFDMFFFQLNVLPINCCRLTIEFKIGVFNR